jgi:drug/metabolite transporter (DMT)-like permease
LRAVIEGVWDRLPVRAPAVAALLAAACIWGSAAVATKTALEYWPPMTLAFVRWSIALAILLALLRRSGERPVWGAGVAMLGLTGLLLFYAFYSWGLRQTTAASGTLIGGGTPVIVAIVAVVALGERVSRRRGLGILVSLAGVTAIVAGGESATGSSLLGNLLVLGSAVSWALYTVLSRRIGVGGNALATLVGTAVYGLIFLLPLAIGELVVSGLGPIARRDVLVMLYLSLGPSAAAYLLWGYGLTQVEASQAAVYGNLMPLVGVILAATLLDETITWVVVSGGFAIVAGAWLATSRGRQKDVGRPIQVVEEEEDGAADQGRARCIPR